MDLRSGDTTNSSGDLRLVLPSRVDLIEPAVEFLVAAAGRHVPLSERQEHRLQIALTEALTNAVVHGNLEVSSSLKETSDRAFLQALADRSAHAIYGSRRVQVHLTVHGHRCRWVVTDEGPGFDVAAVLARDPADPENLTRTFGRGIALMRSFVDEVRYEDGGRRVVLVLHGASGPVAA